MKVNLFRGCLMESNACDIKGMKVFWGNNLNPNFMELVMDPEAELGSVKEEKEEVLIINFFEVLKKHTVATA
jgi:hypothetical protein